MERGGGSSHWWAWCVASPEAVIYRLCRTRSTKSARDLLADYRGIVVCDGYGVHEALQQTSTRAGPTLVHCWAHVHRKFVGIEENHLEASETALEWIGELYRIEREVLKKLRPEPEKLVSLRATLRRERSRPIVDDLKSRAEQTYSEVAALFYSLCETAKLVGVDPSVYLLEATRRALAELGTATLPHDLLS